MKSWVGTRIRHDAELVPCRYCHAIAGAQCINPITKQPLEAFPAHMCRINDSMKQETE